MKYAIAIAIMLSLSFGLVTESFRYQSTAQLFEDDYDLIFDPARIPEIQGSRLWTGLANFVTSDEELFSNNSQPYVLLGGMTYFNNLYPAGVYDRTSSKTPFYTGLNDPLGNEIYGEGTVTKINWNNPDSLGNYQDREVTTETRKAFDASNSSDYYLAFGYKSEGFRFGLGYMHTDSKTTYTDPNDNYDYLNYLEDLSANAITYKDSATSTGDDILKSSENEIIFSAWMDKEAVSFGASVSYSMLGSSSEALINSYEAEYFDPSAPGHNYIITSINDSSYLPQSGNEIDVEFKVFYNYNENAQGRYYGGFFTRSMSYDDDATQYYFETMEHDADPAMTNDTTTTITDYDGSFSSTGFRVGTKQLFSISDRFRFGIGLLWSNTSYDDSTTKMDTSSYVHRYDDGDTIPLMDTVLTQRSSETWVMTRTGSVNSFVIPVGVEFNLADPVVFRMGAIHTIAKNNLTTSYILTDWEAQVTHIVVDTLEYYYYQDPSERPENTSENDASTVAMTDYYYGLGWQVTDNLQLDLMGFRNITDWANWKLSATFHFD
ncbi:MAG TPA: hypothetical protein ENI34_09395 [candidate division WOR-3 bacterium]|uniref:Uncharacterized protein n=1 Tax=candidate division WOR-3 bacterium TaxID=2052148 RepID=A0A9C9K0S7_UNCW3|nr:hypothetical protein [candidate division WOR-3 bacterium]